MGFWQLLLDDGGSTPPDEFTASDAGTITDASTLTVQIDPTPESVTVSGSVATLAAASGDPGSLNHHAFPGAVKLPGNRVLVAERQGNTHSATSSKIRYAVLDAAGNNLSGWTTLRTGAAGVNLADASAFATGDGDELAIMWNESSTPGLSNINTVVDTYIAFASAATLSFGSPVRIDNGFETNAAGTAGAYGIAASPARFRGTGTLVMAVYGFDNKVTLALEYVKIRESTDFGRTWTTLATLTPSGTATGFDETTLLPLDTGRIMAFIRTSQSGGTTAIWSCYSDDDAATFSAPALMISNAGGRPSAAQTAGGHVVLRYRYMVGGTTSGYPHVVVSLDRCSTWGSPVDPYDGAAGRTGSVPLGTPPRGVDVYGAFALVNDDRDVAYIWGEESASTPTQAALLFRLLAADSYATETSTVTEAATVSVTGGPTFTKAGSDTATVTDTATVSATTPGFDLEGFILDGLSLNTTGIYRLEEFTLGPPPKRYEWIGNNDIDGEALLRDPSQGNRAFTLKVRLMADTRDEAQAAHDAIVQKLEKAEKTEGGIVAVWTPVDSTTSYDVHVLAGETTDFPITVESGYFVNKPVITFQGTADTALEGEAQTFGPVTASTPVVELELPGVRGQLPAKATITVTDAAGQARRHVTWGLEQQHYDTSDPSELVLTADDMTALSGTLTTRTDAYDPDAGSSVIRAAALPVDQWTAVCAITDQPHVGIFRVVVRGYGDDVTSLRISWRAGDGSYVPGPVAAVPVESGWFEVDLGAVVIPEATLGAQTWDARIEAYSTEAAHALDVNYAALMPAGEGYARARAVAGADGAAALLGADGFADTSGSLHGATADVGGTWATSGATTDFVNDSVRVTRSTSTADTGQGRIAILGSLTAADISGEVTIGSDHIASGWLTTRLQGGLLLRYTDVDNFLACGLVARYVSSTLVLVYANVVERVGGVSSSDSSAGVELSGGSLPLVTVEGVAYASGHVRVRLLQNGAELARVESSFDSVATGGALESGGVGIRDYASGVSATLLRDYRGFSVGVPSPEQVVCHANQSVAFRHDGAFRENAAGTAYGTLSPRGGSAYVPCAGDDDLTSRIVVAARRADIEASASGYVTDATIVAATLRERFLWPA